jgi:hypothetical protein
VEYYAGTAGLLSGSHEARHKPAGALFPDRFTARRPPFMEHAMTKAEHKKLVERVIRLKLELAKNPRCRETRMLLKGALDAQRLQPAEENLIDALGQIGQPREGDR